MREIMKLDWLTTKLQKPILKDMCVEQEDYPVSCGNDEQTQNKYVQYRKVGVTFWPD